MQQKSSVQAHFDKFRIQEKPIFSYHIVMGRSYSDRTIKLIWGEAASRCSICRKKCISKEEDVTETALIGEIAHIYDLADSDSSPRSNPSLDEKQKNDYSNLLLVCRNCHGEIDQKKKTYSVEDLQRIKNDHEHWVDQKIENAIMDIGFKELEIISKALIANPTEFLGDFTVIPPKEKLNKNNLSSKVSKKVSMGLLKAKEVENFLQNYEGFDSDFSSRLVTGFVDKYLALKNNGSEGDILFDELHQFSSMESNDFEYQAAGLAILVYLFEKCEVFEH